MTPRSAGPNHKATFSLPTRMLDEMRVAVQSGLVASVSELVRSAVSERLHALNEERIRREFAAAARDPMFLSDLHETMEAFEALDSESARMIPE